MRHLSVNWARQLRRVRFPRWQRNANEERAPLPDPSGLIQATKRRALAGGHDIVAAVSANLAQGLRTPPRTYEELAFHADVVRMADEALRLLRQERPPAADIPQPAIPEYLVSSWFLAECAAYLLSHAEGHERLHLATGIKLSDNRRTLAHLVKVPLDLQSPVAAQANREELTKLLIQMDSFGHHLYGLFHSHPGRGVLATTPSGIDLDTHKRFAKGDYPLVSAIFERSGFVRFFSDSPFTISLYGKGVEHVEDHVYKILNLPRPVPDDRPEREEHWTGEPHRPARESPRV
jgi:proteasome lid subunit RPN8/RPN11